MLKTRQDLGCFTRPDEAHPDTLAHLAAQLRLSAPPDWPDEARRTKSLYRYQEAVRAHLSVRPYDELAERLVADTTRKAAEAHSGGVTMASWSRPVVSNTEAMAPPATQEPLPEQGQAAAAAPVAVRTRWPRPVGSGTLVARDCRRVRRQQIIAQPRGVNRDASLFLAAPASGPSGRHASAGHEDSLIAPAGGPQALPARSCATLARAVDLAAVTAAADDHLTAATRAQKQPARSRLSRRCLADTA